MSETETGTILVIGGYGAVGTIVSRTLDGWFPGRVLAAGRRPQRARLAPGITAVRLDLHEPGGLDELLRQYSIGTVVLCVEPPDSALARTCLRQGIHLVDIGASDRLLRKVEAMADLAIDNGATAVLSVGVAPGLTNLLAWQVHETLGGADRLDITVLLGAGEHHGVDAVGWTVGQLGQRYPHRAQSLRVALAGYGTRTAHPFGFSDQYSLRRTLGVGTVTTRLCLDSAPLTALLFGLQRIGAFRTETLRKALTQILARVHIGTSGFAIRVDGHHGGRHAAYTLTGSEQSRITALVAAHVTRQIVTGTLPTGVHHIEQLPALADIPSQLMEHGATLWPPGPRQPAVGHLDGSHSGPMLITAPVVDEDNVSTAGEREVVETFLDYHRQVLRGKLQDLSEQQVRQQHVPSPTTLIGDRCSRCACLSCRLAYLNGHLAERLADRYRGEPVEVVHGSAADVARLVHGPVDVVVSGLPWTVMAEPVRLRILDAVTAVLAPTGVFTTFAYAHAAWTPPGRRFAGELKQRFGITGTSRLVWRNLPPAFVHRATAPRIDRQRQSAGEPPRQRAS